MKSDLKDAIWYCRELSDALPGEESVAYIPGSTPEEIKDRYTREEALRAHAAIRFIPNSSSDASAQAQIEEHERRILMDHIRVNGAEFAEGLLRTPSDESIKTQQVAQAIGMTSAVNFFDTYSIQAIIAHDDCAGTALLACECDLPKSQLQVAKALPPAPIEPRPISIPDVVERKSYVITSEQDSLPSFDAELFREIKQFFKIKNCDGAIYAYDDLRKFYRRVTDDELKLMINSCFGDQILKEGRLDKTYETLVRLIHCESSFCTLSDKHPNPYYWPFLNCIVNIISGETLPNNGEYFHTYCIQCVYDPAAACPHFDQFLNAAAMKNPQVLQLLWETIGYILSPDHSAKKFFVFSGERNSGKSLLANTLIRLVGQTNTSSLSLHDFSKNFGTCDLIGKHLNVSMDLSNTTLSRENIGKIKMLTGDDLIRADIKYQSPVSFYNTAKLLFGTNYSVYPEENDPAFWERMVMIPFCYSVPKSSQDPQLLSKFESELSGIVNSAIAAYLQLKQRNLEFTNILTSSAHPALLPSQMIDYAELFHDAVTANFEFTGQEGDSVSSEDAYKAYVKFCNTQMIEPEERNRFSTRLRKMGAGKAKKFVNGRSLQFFTGVRMK